MVEQIRQGNSCSRIYPAVKLRSDFTQTLNVVIISQTNTRRGVSANVNLFSSDLELPYVKIIALQSLHFQIEFNFKDAKQYWVLEDFMYVKEIPFTNALNLSLFMVNLTQVPLRDFRRTPPERSTS